ncbi:phytanoyl-CoA dioxygenase family protein [Brachybacterium sacelli]|uniref:Ectoine hydroxylase-related dioxygenase (Phytanoyl-CoA dioxygenase family) n=2 Tax=Brachybacterium sacelli TaxID=173364 RepID=A0ABS4WVQ8_9MICO|nr:ectoine hydroxylase-related dioxygenase (phytanoyl-CoA dioxygenase family) [Brachybacterium sacelli]
MMTTLSTTRPDLDALADTYDQQGYVLVKGLLSKEEAAEYRGRSHELIASLDRGDDPTWDAAADVAMGQATSLQHLHDAQFYDAAFTRLLTDPRFTSVAAAVLRTPNVQLHHSKMFIKPPENGSPFPPHQDHPFFPHTHHRVAAAIFHFDDAPEVKGCVRIAPGSHTAGPREHDPQGSFHLPDFPVDQLEPMEAEAGDVLFFTYLTVHSSGVNVSDEARTTWLVQFRDPADPPLTDQHNHSLGQGLILAGSDPTGRAGQA